MRRPSLQSPLFPRPLFLRHQDTVLAWLLAAAVFGVYLWTLCPTLYWGDCGELATAVATLGIPHPTGYPLYCLLGKAWTLLLPLGSLVWRLNVLSAAFGALAAACLYGFARAVALPRPPALVAGGLLAFSSTFWQQSLLTETYTLAALFTCLLLFLAARWRARGCREGDLRLLALAYGFALTSHQTNTLFLPGFVAFILWSAPALRRLGDRAVRAAWAKTLGLGALPLLTYLYLPLRARMHPAYSWGDVETPFAFCYHVTGRLFAPLMFHQRPIYMLDRLLTWAYNLPMEFSWPLVGLAVLGLGAFWARRADRPLALLLTWVVAADIGFVINYGIYNGYIYYIPVYAVMSVCAARGLFALWQTLEPHLEARKRPAFGAFGALCAVCLVPMQAASHRHVSLRGNWTCYDYGQNLLASVPPHGLLIENGDDTAAYAVLYLQTVEGRRRDVTLVQRAMLSTLYDPAFRAWANAWYLDSVERSYPRLKALYPASGPTVAQVATEDPLRRMVRDAVARGTTVCLLAPAGVPVWFNPSDPILDDDGGRMLMLPAYLSRHYSVAQVGLTTRLYPKGSPPSARALQSETESAWRSYSLRGVFGGGLLDDRYLMLLALNYSHAALARAQVACYCGDYATAADAYAGVLTLFDSDEASEGLKRCRQGHRGTRVMAARGPF